jgi:DNA mismatch endonuclease (patch repair protein)
VADQLSPERRSENMRRISSKGTKPEILVRRLVYELGYRYRLHVGNLPGKPDLVFRKLRKAIFVHGCFWHLHKDCPEGRIPKSRREYWEPKLLRNVERDARHVSSLRELGWQTLVIWECETTHPKGVERKITQFLRS